MSKKKQLPIPTIQEIEEKLDSLVKNASEKDIQKAQTGLGFSAAKFAMRFVDPKENQELYSQIYNLFFTKVKASTQAEPIQA